MAPKEITLDGVKYPVYFGYNALLKVERATGIPFARIGELFAEVSLENLALMVRIAIEEGARKAKEPAPELTEETILDALDASGDEGFADMIEALTSFLFAGEGGAKEPAGEA